MPNTERDYLRNLIAGAKTPEDLEAAEQLLRDWNSRHGNNRWTVKTLGEVAEFFGLHSQTVKQWRTENPPMPGKEGSWDLQLITNWRFAKLNNRRDSPLRDARDQVEIEKREAEVRALHRKEQMELGNILPADVYVEFCRELLGMIRVSLEELPESIAEHFAPEFRHFFYVPDDQQQSERDASQLQKGIRKLITDIDNWLSENPGEETE